MKPTEAAAHLTQACMVASNTFLHLFLYVLHFGQRERAMGLINNHSRADRARTNDEVKV